jgi:S-formylglutathione hydrolase FrmB
MIKLINKIMIKLIFICGTFLFSLPLLAQQDYSQGTEQSFFSKILPTHQGLSWLVKYRVILPRGYNSDQINNVVYFLHGRDGDRYTLENLGVLEQLNTLSMKNKYLNFIIVAPECGNCYWMNAALKNERWGDVVTQELIADVEKKYLVSHQSSGRLLAGISMGGHGSIQLALNNPHIYGAVAAHSPVFRTQEEASQDFNEQFGKGDAYQLRDPFSLIKFKNKKLNIPIWMDIGGSDFAFSNTKNFADLLRTIGFQGELHIGEDPIGTHSGGYWSFHLYSYLEWYLKNLGHL